MITVIKLCHYYVNKIISCYTSLSVTTYSLSVETLSLPAGLKQFHALTLGLEIEAIEVLGLVLIVSPKKLLSWTRSLI